MAIFTLNVRLMPLREGFGENKKKKKNFTNG